MLWKRKRRISPLVWIAPAALLLFGAILQAEGQGVSTVAEENQPGGLPDSPGAVATQISSPSSSERQSSLQVELASSDQAQNAAQGQIQAAAQPVQSTTPSPSAQTPVGTAAAGAPRASGIAASQPAGVAIAPAKQHRLRTIVLKTGAIIAAGAALGTVVALSAATPSKPPGAH
jgi:hypothetical protein